MGGAGRDGTVYLPLRFWFNRNPGLALPLIALQYHEVKVNLTTKVSASNTNARFVSAPKLLVNYLYLDTDERRRFAQVSHEYLIEQVQHTGYETKGNITMNFNHPVKALFWTADALTTGELPRLQLNGHDRFSAQAHDYFHLVQPYECGLGHGKTLKNDDRSWINTAIAGDTSNVSMYSL